MKTKKAKKDKDVQKDVLETKAGVVSIDSLRSSIEAWKEVLLASAETPEQVANYNDTAVQMNKFVDIVRDAMVPEMKALAIMCLNSVYYGSPFIGELLYLFDGMSKGKRFIETPDKRILENPVGEG